MKTDNMWHFGILVRMKDKNFQVYDSLDKLSEEFNKECKKFGQLPPEGHVCLYKYNKGQPLLRYNGREFSIVDLEREIIE